MLFFFIACLSHHKGIVNDVNGRVTVTTAQGQSIRIFSAEHSLADFEGCILTVDGIGGGRWIFVQDYEVLDAGDGSAPFMGIVERRGVQYFLNDKRSGALLRLHSDEELSEYDGMEILVVGYIIGPHDLKVVSLRSINKSSK